MNFIITLKAWTVIMSLLMQFPLYEGRVEDRFCCLCEGCDFPIRDKLLINPYGLTCQKLDSDMFNPNNDSKPGNELCLSLQEDFRPPCCDPNINPDDVPQISTPAPSPSMSQGDEPPCDICTDGSYPAKPYTLITAAYIPGTHTCSELYWMGRKGHILASLCYPIQIFLKDSCGCGLVIQEPTSSPTGYPAPLPTLSPSLEPTKAPTPQSPTLPQMMMGISVQKNDLKLGYPGERVRGSTGINHSPRGLIRGQNSPD